MFLLIIAILTTVSFQDGTYKVEAYDSIVTVVEPALSIFDLKLYE